MNEKIREMAFATAVTGKLAGDYTPPAIDRRIADLRQRRIGALEGLTTGESIKESLAKYKECRNTRRTKLKTTHRHILEVVSYILNTETINLEEGIIDADEYVENLTSFLSEGGKSAIAVCHQPMSPPPLESGRWTMAAAAAIAAAQSGTTTAPAAAEETSLRCCVTDGSSEYLSGRCVIVYRLKSNLSFELKQLLQETYYAYAEADPVSKSALAGVSELVSRLHQPLMVGNGARSIVAAWAGGHLSEAGSRTIAQNLVGDFEDSCHFLSVTRDDIDNTIKLEIDRDLSDMYSPAMLRQDEKRPSEYTRLTPRIEETVGRWMRIIERSIVESQQLRRETETIGPRAELMYWRRLLVRFSSIVEEIERPQVQMLLRMLVLARSGLIKKWKKLVEQVTTIRILSRDNVKYLYALEKFTRPLYRLDPTKIGEYLSALIYAVKTTYATSRFFNTRRIVSPIFVKITNQLIVGCKAYLRTSEDGGNDAMFWRDGKYSAAWAAALTSRMKDCVNLCTRYHECYTEILAKEKLIDDSTEQPALRLSEMSVFGKFNTFKTRLNKLMDVLETASNYSILKSSRIEGIESFADKFVSYFEKLSEQKYDPLDHRESSFDVDYDEFKRNVLKAEADLEIFFDKTVSIAPDLSSALCMIARFEKLKVKCLRIERKYVQLLDMLGEEIERVRDRYNEDRSDPPLPRNVPPFAGRIFWIRQLHKRLEAAMNFFKNRRRVIGHERGQRCVKLYNALTRVFVHYEVIHYKAWIDSSEIVRLALSLPLLVMVKDEGAGAEASDEYQVNFEPYVLQVIQEAEHASRFGLTVPGFFQTLILRRDELAVSYETIKGLLERRSSLLLPGSTLVPDLFTRLTKRLATAVRLDESFRDCLSVVYWTSLEIGSVCRKIDEAIERVELFVKDITDTMETRIERVFESIAETIIVRLADHAKESKEFYDDNENLARSVAQLLETKSAAAERAALAILTKFRRAILGEEDVERSMYDWLEAARRIENKRDGAASTVTRFDNECILVFTTLNRRLVEALVRSTKTSLDLLRQRLGTLSTMPIRESTEEGGEAPIVVARFVLRIPNVTVHPSVQELQNIFNAVVSNALGIHESIIAWGERYAPANQNTPSVASRERGGALENGENATATTETAATAGLPRNYRSAVAEHKQVVRSLMSLRGVVLMLKDDVAILANSYAREYSFVWAEDRVARVKLFVDSNPTTEEIKEKLQEYEDLMEQIKNLAPRRIVGPIEIDTDELKMGLLVEAEAWKRCLAVNLSSAYRLKLKRITEYTTDKSKILGREMKDLEDVRVAMACLSTLRDDFVSLDLELMAIEESYGLMAKYGIEVSKEEQETVDALRYNFGNMLDMAKRVRARIGEMQEPLRRELTEGVADLARRVEEFDKDFECNGPMVEGISAKEASERLLLAESRLDELRRDYETYSSGERLFGIDVSEYPALDRRVREINLLQKLYGLYRAVMRSIDGYSEIAWSEIDIEAIVGELAEFQNKCRKLPKAMREWPAYVDLKNKIDNFNEICPLLEMMANRAVKDRHWSKISQVCGHFFNVESEAFTLANVMEARLLDHKDDLEDICVSAVKEMDIESKLRRVVADWAVVDLEFANFKQRGPLLLKGVETGEIIAQLEDSLMLVGSLLANRYNAPFKKEIQQWQTKLSNTLEILAKWLNVQNLWVYLEAVFIGGDISRQLPAEAKRFGSIDKSWVKLMYRAHEKLNAVETCTGDDTMLRLLPHLLEQLESCQKSLSGYLETKRAIFPRFCFISDPSLLEILGQAADSHTIEKYLDGFFDNVAKLDFAEKEYDKIIAIYSREGEKITLESEVACTGGVENWLDALLKMHQRSVGAAISLGLQQLTDPETDILKLIDASVLQVGLLAVQVSWTRDAQVALLASKRDRTIMKRTNQWFLDLLNGLIQVTVSDLSKYARAKYEALITIHVHQRDIFDGLCHLRVRSINDFEWLKQARFYYEEESEDVCAKITDVTFVYQNEFLGCTDRLAVTPLTDRCYITLAQAIGMNFGGAPAGPAGTGKTETTKDMGKALGKYVVVFNCSNQMDFRGLGRIFKGLAQAGAWGCFDEFNRIDLPVLSVAAQQIAIILTARRERKTSFLFGDGQVYKLDYEVGLFITMNPGYAGRQELPENLKVQFRSVAMMVPDRQIIMRVKLAACGFRENVALSRKFFTLYKLCEEQLSKQVHYDFGLRNILSCLRTLGAQKRAHPGDSEETTLMRVLRDMNLSKLVDEDEPLFTSLVNDMFPDTKVTGQTYKELQRGIANACVALGIENHAEWNLKTVQLYETWLVRHGLMVLGPTGSGKTRCMWALMRAMTEMGMPHKEFRMNPKAITDSQMFGKLDVATNEWTDGIFSTLWRRSTRLKKSEYVWIVLDGPVDAVWIENLNSVLDDNKTLTLANGDRIVMAANSKLLFEPDNIDNASPATVSRMGMVFLSASVLGWKQILESWLKKRPAAVATETEHLGNLFRSVWPEADNFLRTKLVVKMFLLEAMYIRQCLDLLTGLLSIDSVSSRSHLHVERLFLFAVMWSLGAVLEHDGREALQEFLVGRFGERNWPRCKGNETIFEYTVSGPGETGGASEGEWIHWNSLVASFVYPDDRTLDYCEILVPNVDNARTLFLVEVIARQEKAVLLIGEPGTAKTVMIQSYLAKFDPEERLGRSFNFSSASTPNMVQRVIESYVEKRVGNTYGPSGGRKMSIFIDDINMPIVNEWGDQVTNEIVRQLMEYEGFYSLDKPGDFSNILDIAILAAMIHPGGGRNDIPPRLKRQFNIFNCTLPSDSSMDTIFGSIGQGYFSGSRFSQEIVEFLPKLIPATRLVWQRTKVKMLPTPANFHYVFNLRDLSRIWEGLLRIERDECEFPGTLVKLWRHECTRVIADRFTNPSDKEWFQKTIEKTAELSLGAEDYRRYYAPEEAYFVNFLREAPEPTGDEPEDFVLEAPKTYEEVVSWETLLAKVTQGMEQLNEYTRGVRLDLVLFREALVHLVRISRVIGVPRGNAMLVGVGGSGKRSLARLATFIAGYNFFQIVLTRSYNVTSLMDDLRKLYREAGTGTKGLTFVFTDNDVKEESYLEFINNVLSVGEIPDLFAKDELDEILESGVPALMKKDHPKRPPTRDNLYAYFVSRARNNLHLVLCFSPVSEKFRTRALKFPGLISGCTIDWFSRWPKDALCAVSQHRLASSTLISRETKQQLVLVLADIHDDATDVCLDYYDRFRRSTYVTLKSFLTFVDDYKLIHKNRLDEINALAFKMSGGLDKLVDAAAQVDVLRQILEKNQAEIAIKNVQVEAILETVNEKKREAEGVKQEVLASKEQAESLLEVITREKSVAEDKLRAAEPAMREAEAALLTIKSTDIATVRKLGKPPYLITLIMDCVLILFGKKLDSIKPDPERQFLTASWSEALKVMADTRFLYNLQHFPKDNINGETVDLLRPYFDYHLYTYEAAKQACGNVAGLLQWTLAMADFYAINKDVLPLKANLAFQRAKHEAANRSLAQAEALLRQKDQDLRIVQNEFDAVMAERQEIVALAEACRSKMDTASAMIEGLAGERVRWTDQLSTFKSEIERLPGDAVVLAAFLSYCGPYNQEFRMLLSGRCVDFLHNRKIPVSVGIDPIESLTDAATVGEWNLQGLPNDDLSTQNGILATRASRYPLMIDPQLQAKTWIKNKEKESDLQVTHLVHKYFRNHLEDSVSIGRPVLIEDVGEELDPVLDNLLERNYIKIGTSLKVKLGDKEVDMHKDFRLYFTTKLANPSYTPEIFARTSVIDFTVTINGLQDQLLGRVISTEKSQLETERTRLMSDVTSNKRRIKQLETNLLHKLTTVQGALIEDVELMSVLDATRRTASEVNEALRTAKETEVMINAAREEFREVAIRGSVLYFLLADMARVNRMYQTSLAQFLERFDVSMSRSEKSPVTRKRIRSIIDYLTLEIFEYEARGLYENHKYTFVVLMALKIDLQRGWISHEEFRYLTKGGAALDLKAVAAKPFKWITDATWLNLVALSSLPQFRYVPAQVEASEKAWKSWFDKDAPEEEPLPDGYGERLDTFRKLLVVRAWCMDRSLSQSRKYVRESLGNRFAEPVIPILEVIHAESRPDTPIVCLLSSGSDPTIGIERLAKKMEIACKSVSMGQGQEIHARRLMANAKMEGYWALCQNCHLGLEYMVELVQFLANTGGETSHPDFRVWLTTEPHEQFPISLLHMSIKFTYEPPRGIRAGLVATYSSINQETLDQCDAAQYAPLVYALSFLHTVLQERRKFGPLGWNIPYEFNSADWLASVIFVNNHLNDLDPKRGISWSTVRYMVGEVQYGGRVTDDYDKRLLNAFARVWLSESLFADTFAFSRGYELFRFKRLPEYLEAFELMPAIDPPQAYGLHSNADVTYQSNTTQDLLDTIVSVQPREVDSVGGGESREASVARQAEEMLAKLPPDYNPFQVKERLRIMDPTTPMNTFLKQEIDRMRIIMKLVSKMLQELLLAIEGTIVMNEQLRDALDDIYEARVPRAWESRSWQSSTLGFWFTEFLDRDAQFRDWIFVARPPKFWLTGFFNPQGFLTAVKQEIARANRGWALDKVTLDNQVTRLATERVKTPPPGEGVYVYGLYLEGAGWDRRNNRLCESAKKILYVSMPVIYLTAVHDAPEKNPKLYECPLYKKPKRTYILFVCPLWLETLKTPDFWTLRGVALLCDNK